jgi:hypothetical protein
MKEASVQMQSLKRFFVLLFVSGAVSATAAVPSGDFHYVFTNNAPLWDVTGTYHLSGTSNGATDHATFVISNAANGAITGTQTEVLNDGTITVDAYNKVTGKIGVKAGIPSAKLKSSGTITASDTDGSENGTAKGKSTASIVESNLTVEVAFTEAFKLKHFGSKKFSAVVSTALLGGMTGDWTLDTTITNNVDKVDKLGGTGTLTLSNGRTFTYQITGSYSEKSELAKLKLAGARGTAAAGTSLSLITTNAGAGEAEMTLTTLKGKILGQKPTILP